LHRKTGLIVDRSCAYIVKLSCLSIDGGLALTQKSPVGEVSSGRRFVLVDILASVSASLQKHPTDPATAWSLPGSNGGENLDPVVAGSHGVSSICYVDAS